MSQRFIRCAHCGLPHGIDDTTCPITGRPIEARRSRAPEARRGLEPQPSRPAMPAVPVERREEPTQHEHPGDEGSDGCRQWARRDPGSVLFADRSAPTELGELVAEASVFVFEACDAFDRRALVVTEQPLGNVGHLLEPSSRRAETKPSPTPSQSIDRNYG